VVGEFVPEGAAEAAGQRLVVPPTAIASDGAPSTPSRCFCDDPASLHLVECRSPASQLSEALQLAVEGGVRPQPLPPRRTGGVVETGIGPRDDIEVFLVNLVPDQDRCGLRPGAVAAEGGIVSPLEADPTEAVAPIAMPSVLLARR